MPRFRDIPQFTRQATYAVDIPWGYFVQHYVKEVTEGRLDVNPAFQRGYVWTQAQQVRYVEFILRGGATGRNIYCNDPTWMKIRKMDDPNYVLVDGKQRVDAVLSFLNNEFKVFGHFYHEFEDKLSMTGASFRWHVNDLATHEEVLQWYLDLNVGGTVHSDDEINKVREMLARKEQYVRPDAETLKEQAGFNRQAIVVALQKQEEEEKAREEARRAAPPAPTKRGRRK